MEETNEKLKSPEKNQILQVKSPSPKEKSVTSPVKRKLNYKKFLLVGIALILITMVLLIPLLLKNKIVDSKSEEIQNSKVISESPSISNISTKAPTFDRSEFESSAFSCEDKGDYFQLNHLERIQCVLRNDNSALGFPSDNKFVFRKSAYSGIVEVKLYAIFQSSSNSCQELIASIKCIDGPSSSTNNAPSTTPTHSDNNDDDFTDYQGELENNP
jgi:hypothetical protein